MENNQKKIVKSVGIVSGATMLSRILGLVREQVFAFMFGASAVNDAFVAAFRIPNLLRDMFAEGALASAFVPVFTDVMKKRSLQDAFRVANLTINALLLILSVITILGIIFTPAIVGVIAPGFAEVEGKTQLTITLTRIMFPFLILVSLAALIMGVLNSLHHFATPALAPAIFNVCMIGAGFLICPFLKEPIIGMAIGALLGGLFQLLIQLPALIKAGFRYIPRINFRDEGVVRIIKLMAPASIGLAAVQINILINTLLASFLSNGSVSYLNYSFRLMYLPLGVFGVAIGTVSLPTVAACVSKGDMDGVKKTIAFCLNLLFLLTIPSTIGLIVLSEPIIGLIYEHGNFHRSDTIATANALICYAFGLFPYASLKILVPVFYSLKDVRTPVKVSIICVGINIILNLVLMRFMAHMGLALATSIAAGINMASLFFILRKRIGKCPLKEGSSYLQVLIASGVMALVCWYINKSLDGYAARVGLGILAGGVTFLVLCKLLKVKEIEMLLKRVSVRK
ncbi:murein biosynthesis integral membrane protein MurJ [Candidatus Desantisbacteria bacterium CG_4_10_14_3_um_filter_40_18]|uniref:Probable lipid II flippase MurJ n=3 Tax=unclassified Candidatus Desantisiibacteriota TaxID=3106372 RepID=A0A2M7P0U7_9BACT|nr:MAG: murein biosynthesis integral membrane protein MurJ [Candidatus Desantisbacteria bacterium CG23_combo_of_CG06-09_8_20_14_all_40_23]PIY19213.1 MAG: murein biosynthesis integral membrane protein MurJ [Candidatus Desantisbacteria bacterium CG_4_10_14_3_um_filter_40_18]